MDDLSQYMDYRLKPNFRVAGPILGSKVKKLGPALTQLDAAAAAPRLKAETITIDLDGAPVELNKDMVK